MEDGFVDTRLNHGVFIDWVRHRVAYSVGYIVLLSVIRHIFNNYVPIAFT